MLTRKTSKERTSAVHSTAGFSDIPHSGDEGDIASLLKALGTVKEALLLILWVGSGALRRVRGRSSQVKGAGGVAARGRCAPPWTCEPRRPLGQSVRSGRGPARLGCAAPPNLGRVGGRCNDRAVMIVE